MTSPNPTPGESEQVLLAVCVADDINPTLTGHAGHSYESPPQPREQALTLVQVLLGYTGEQLDGAERWTCPIAGGRRTVAVKRTTNHWRVSNAPGSLQAMPTLVLGPPPPELKALLERRRRAGLDRLDEVWEGVLHVIPTPSGAHADVAQQLAVLLDRPAREAGLFPTMHEFNLGDGEDDFRVPDGGIHRQRLTGVWHPTAALVVEIFSPGDETWEKLPFYAAHRVDEVLIVDPQKRSVDWLAFSGDGYGPVERSRLLEDGPQYLAAQIDWPERR